MMTDAELLRVYMRDRDEAAFAELVRRHVDSVYSSALRRVCWDAQLAEDVTQQVFVALARKAANLTSHPGLSAWLFTATRHEAANVVRRERRRKYREQKAAAMNEINSPDSSGEDWSRVAPVLDAAIDELGETDRLAVLLRFFDRKPFAEIGAALRVTEDGARRRVERAVDKLRVRLARRGVTSSAAALGLALTGHAVAAAPMGLAANAAICASAAATPPALGVLGSIAVFMSSTKITCGAAALAVALTLGAISWSGKSRRAAEEALTATKRDHDLILANLQALEQQHASVASDRAEIARLIEEHRAAIAAARERAAAAADGALTAPPTTRDRSRAAGDAFLARHPEVRLAIEEFASARVRFGSDEIIRKLGLTPNEVEKLEGLLHSQFGMGATTADETPMTLYASNPGGSSSYRELLGPDRAKQLSDFNLTIRPAREHVVRIAGALWFTDEPLAPEQSAQLVRILAESARPAAERASNPMDRFDWTAVAQRAAAVLSPAQMRALDYIRAHDEFGQALNRPPARQAAAPSSSP